MADLIKEDEKKALVRYGEVKNELKDLTKELDLLKPSVRDVLMRVGAEDTPVDTGIGKFSLRPRRKWTYSPELEAQMEKVKQSQKHEEATGGATFETSFDVYFK